MESLLHPGHVVFKGDNKNLIVYKEENAVNRGYSTNQKFSYKSSTHAWLNDFTGNYISIDAFKAGANVVTENPNPKDAGQKWYLEFCDGHVH